MLLRLIWVAQNDKPFIYVRTSSLYLYRYKNIDHYDRVCRPECSKPGLPPLHLSDSPTDVDVANIHSYYVRALGLTNICNLPVISFLNNYDITINATCIYHALERALATGLKTATVSTF